MTLKDFKANLKGGKIGNLYLFYGEEGYLREYYLGELQKQVVGDMMPEFNVTVINRAPEFNELSDVVESYPAMNDRRLVIVRDFDVVSANADFSAKAEKLFSDMPEHTVLVFVYSNPESKPDKRKKLYKVIEKFGDIINFECASKTDLLSWIARRFMAAGKEIDAECADYLLYYSGERMELLIPEIEKVSAYSKKKNITKSDIEAVATRNLSSVVFDVTNAIAEGNYAKALGVISELRAQNEEPIPTLALIARQFRRMYGTKLILENGGGKREVMDYFEMKSDYPARILISATNAMKKDAIANAIELCKEADLKLKLSAGWDEISKLVAEISAGEAR